MITAEGHLRAWVDQTIRPVLREMLRDELADLLPTLNTNLVPDVEPYGAFSWLCSVCSGIPESTLRIKSAAGMIPGVKKVGKRVLYEKAAVLKWLQDIPSIEPIDSASIEGIVEAQVKGHIRKRADRQTTKKQAAGKQSPAPSAAINAV